jgi:putative salt-induced outer membrane protein YdiY
MAPVSDCPRCAADRSRFAQPKALLAGSGFAVYPRALRGEYAVQRLDRLIISVSLLATWFVCSDPVRAQTPPPSEPPVSAPAPSSAGTEAAPPPDAKPADPPPAAAAVAAPAPAPAPPPIPAPAAPPPAPGTFAEKVSHEAPKGDVTSLTASGGGALNSGNTNSYQVNLGADFALIRQPHGVSANASFAYGVADNSEDDSDDLIASVRNLNAKARYDYFVSLMDAVFAATVFRWDPFAGIDRRNQGQLGYLRYLMREDKHRFWGELGYDLTSDNYGPVEGKPDAMIPADEEVIIHSVRLFFGYENKLNSALSYLGGIEGLMNVEDPGDTRINFSNALNSSISNSFQLQLKLTLAYDSKVPTVDTEKLDTTLIVNLVYALI